MGKESKDVEAQRPLLDNPQDADAPAVQPALAKTDKAPAVAVRMMVTVPAHVASPSPYPDMPLGGYPIFSTGRQGILRKAMLAVVIYFSIGTVFFYHENNSLVGERTQPVIDALYLCTVTLTTVGYGDLVPSSSAVKLFTCAYVFVGFGLVGALLTGAASYLVQKQEKILEKAVLHSEQQQSEDEDHLAEDDDLRSAHWKAVISGVMFVVLLIMGVAFIMRYEGFTLVDAIYCVSVTVTTLGYGDRSFKTAPGRLFAVIWILASTLCAAQFFLSLSEVQTEGQQRELAHWVLNRKPTKADLEAADFNKDHVVSAPEFVIMKLKEMGKIDEDDVTGILQHFNHLVHSNTDVINIQDLNLAQPS
ncbi:hypothetical protein R1sor_013723 [Riccia sorocarpa]|uniref:Potassium channel domain-containing protein n=1 Tax=Riccia sorocarpa TaxID=122646 RepID=A0ABD3HB82_9MARC